MTAQKNTLPHDLDLSWFDNLWQHAALVFGDDKSWPEKQLDHLSLSLWLTDRLTGVVKRQEPDEEAGREEIRIKQIVKTEGSSCLCCIAGWHCPVQDLSFLLVLVVPRGCCHATQCGRYTHTHTHTGTNNGPLYEVPTDAMVTSSFWARRAEWRAKKMPCFLFFPFSNHVAQKPFET